MSAVHRPANGAWDGRRKDGEENGDEAGGGTKIGIGRRKTKGKLDCVVLWGEVKGIGDYCCTPGSPIYWIMNCVLTRNEEIRQSWQISITLLRDIFLSEFGQSITVEVDGQNSA